MKSSLLKVVSLVTVLQAVMPLQAKTYSKGCQGQFWLETDYLYCQIQDAPKVIPLAIEQPVVNGPFDVVLGGETIKNDWHSGGRFAAGYWVDKYKNLGAEVSYFFLGKNSKHSHIASNENGEPRLRIPYFNVTTDSKDSSALATPALFKGRAAFKVSNKMQGAEFNLLKNFGLRKGADLAMFAGFRYWNFEDHFTFSVNSPLVATPTIYNYRDKFDTENNFYGTQIGASLKQRFNPFIVDIVGKIAFGTMRQKSTIKGVFHTNEFTDSLQTFKGGFFALPTNIGRRKKTVSSIISEVNLNVEYQITRNFNISVGYLALYATEVLRATKQINNRLNPTQSANIEFTPTPTLVGKPSPKAKLKTTSLWAQGTSIGLNFRF